ncbi:hypothetical protein BDK51DRAFT_21585, partial [Blyttiomyces helicus]
ANFYALCSDTMLKAMVCTIESIENLIAPYYLDMIATPAEIAVLVGEDNSSRALAELVPSVTAA